MDKKQIKEDLLFLGSLELGEGHTVDSLSAFHRIQDYIFKQKSKAYIFRMNGRIINKEELDSCLQFEQDYCDLFVLGKIECEDCSGYDTVDEITIEEIEVSDNV